MASNDDDVVLKLDLDSEAFTKKMSSASETLNAFGSGENVQGLVDKISDLKGTMEQMAGDGGSLSAMTAAFAEWGVLIGAAAIAVGTFAGGLSMTLQGEQIEAVNREFDLLAKNAGIAGNEMKEAFIKSTDGMMTGTEALQLANTAMMRLGATAAQLPQLMELARKSALVTGDDLSTSFNNMVRAVSTGNARMLQRIGLTLDVKKAERDYADTLGIAENSLTQAAKQQAVMNALLEQGNSKLSGIDSSLKPVTTSWQQLKTSLSEFGEAFSLIIEHTFGSAFQGWIALMSKASKATRNFFVENFGTGAESAKLKAASLDDKIRDLATSIVKLQNQLGDEKSGKTGFWGKFFSFESGENLQNTITAMKATYEKLKQERDKLVAADQKKETGTGAPGTSPQVKQDQADKAILSANEAKFLKELDALKKQEAARDIQLAQTSQQLDSAEKATRLANAQKLASDIRAIRTREDLDANQKSKLIAQLHKTSIKDAEEFEAQSTNRRIKMLDNYAAHAKGTWQGFSRAAEVASKKASIDLQNTATIGEKVFGDLSAGVGNAFQQMGAAAAGGSGDIEHAILGMLGKVAAEYGTVMMLASIWPFNPPVFAAGAALEILAGALGAMGSSSSASPPSPSSAAASDPATALGATGVAGTATPNASTASAQTAPHVSINVQGSVFDSPATGMRMVDLIRNASDQTGYNYVQIGNKPYGT